MSRYRGNTFSSRSEITGGLSSNLPSALHRHKGVFRNAGSNTYKNSRKIVVEYLNGNLGPAAAV
jgi:hypothetical protein